MYEVALDVQTVAEKLIKKFPKKFGHISADWVFYVRKEGDSQRLYAKTRCIKEPYNLLTDKRYIIEVIEKRYAALTVPQQHLLVYHELCHIPEEEGGLVRHDIEDFKDILKEFGIDWTQDAALKDILD